MAVKQPMSGPGLYQWNTGGWFGSQVGCTSWILVGAVVLAFQAPRVAVVWLGCFAFANAISTWLWLRRDRMRPFPAMQFMLLACGMSALTATIALNLAYPDGVPEMMIETASPGGVRLVCDPGMFRSLYRILLLFPALMAFFAIMDRFARPGLPPDAAMNAEERMPLE